MRDGRQSHVRQMVFVVAAIDIVWLASPYLRWLRGQPLSGTELSVAGFPDWPLGYWGRLGKVLQFIGGATAILDLLDPREARQREIAARERLQRARLELRNFHARHDVYDVTRRIYQDIVGVPNPEPP